MRMVLISPAVLGAALLLGGCSVAPFEANDTGGIIAWSPEAEHYRHDIAGDYCAHWGKLARITSVHRHYGDYIGFACYRPRGAEPGIVTRVAR